jgi:hypothetical protein
MNLNLLIELKNEYTKILLEILTPIVHEGIQYIYNQAKNNSGSSDTLKTFQNLLKKIPEWEDKILTKEYNRIIVKTKKNSPWIVELIRAVIKANITILTVNKIPENVYEEINILNFIHLIYIEIARKLWNNPFLFYHDYPSLEIKRNLRDSLQLIDNSIISAIRKILPMNIILQKYLGDNTNYGKEFNFDINVNAEELKNIPLLLELNSEHYTHTPTKRSERSNYSKEEYSKHSQTPVDSLKKTHSTQSKHLHNSMKSPNTPSLNNKILKLIDENKVNLTESNEIFQKQELDKQKNENKDKSSSTLKKIIHQSINKSAETKSLSINSNVKNKVKKSLADSESITYNKEDNNKKYQDVFSNSDVNNGIIQQETNLNTQDQNENKSREKFFNNYLNF